MSVSALGTAHLQQTKLSTKAVEPIADWLSTLPFTPAEVEFDTLNHPQLKAKMTPLLTEDGFIDRGLWWYWGGGGETDNPVRGSSIYALDDILDCSGGAKINMQRQYLGAVADGIHAQCVLPARA
ncbi:hypothetical protein VC83_03106 [Pseudogymnoascus destructans]|uniref:Uncharacterized protein n=1 Tax=Pseudogymnoascus destructans TaxID=655981 RepID=A0A177AD54_9PEZI|nr:uncharacterized protein VC83_03106 [Pseudogymnoascus destructans]OAF60035.1 hypothetical protein VC83_03106 [Pseudogymnoascus destructans]